VDVTSPRSVLRALPPPVARPALVLVALAAGGFLVLAVGYAWTGTAVALDMRVDPWIRAVFADHRAGLRRLVRLGSPRQVVLIAVLLALVCLWLNRRRLALVAVAGPGATGVATTLLQPLIGRPLNGGFGLPSGHGAGLVALGTVAALVVVSLAGSRLRAVAPAAAAGVVGLGAAMTVALVANSYHYTTDALAGFCTGVAVVLATALAVDHVADRLARAARRAGGPYGGHTEQARRQRYVSRGFRRP
jgi:hypothetical protein